MSDDDTKTATVEYLALLKQEFHRIWPHGTIRSSEYSERDSFDKMKSKITALQEKIKEELL